ncbi:MAG TPA: alpha/beta hydrolase, partial [Thermoanaerobaculia bacterium]|nr:alpha/beta hydrolase [Thermoanaerobaculia bacterium]
MADALKQYTFVVPGQEAGISRGRLTEPSAEIPHAQVKQSVRLSSRRAGGPAAEVKVQAVAGQDAVLLHIAGGPTLTLHPENAYVLMQSQNGGAEGNAARGKAAVFGQPETEDAASTVRVPSQFQWSGLEEGAEATRGATRGWLGKVLLSGLEVITFDTAADLTAKKIAEEVDGQVREGLYRLSPEDLPNLKERGERVSAADPAAGPILVLIHGTFSTTSGTFGKLWAYHPARVQSLFDHYNGQVYALDHPTLGASPIENALTLVEALPPKARLHLLTHSRGGLVAEVLARLCANAEDGLQYDSSADDREAMVKLVAAIKQKNIRVDRLVRVACPARGTLLASKRLDAYLSVFKWTLDLADIPVAPEVLDFLAAVAKRRTDPRLLPGLEAQIPDSPLVQWLHNIEEPIAGDRRVIAGDVRGDSVVSWLQTLMADSFYWTDNDLVVQTRSMYGGAPRAESALFVLDQGGEVSHFNYFRNDRTAGAIVGALIEEKPPQEFRTIGPLSWAGESSTGIRAARRDLERRSRPDRPALLLLPGIAGSNLKVGDRRIWVGWRLFNGLKQLGIDAKGVAPDGPIESYYEDLAEFLSETHEVIEFGFDWRLPIEQEAKRLAREVTRALDARAKTDQPVRILAHSMGGIVARTLQLEEPAVWD